MTNERVTPEQLREQRDREPRGWTWTCLDRAADTIEELEREVEELKAALAEPHPCPCGGKP